MIYLVVISAILHIISASDNRPMLRLEEGLVQGISRISAKGQKYYAFEGIPYAESPEGILRFKEPVPVKSWPGVWPAFTPGCKCLQYAPTRPASERVQGHENCLYVTVYTPKLPSNNNNEDLMDVVVWLHAGGFTYGSGEVDPKYIMDNNLILVTLNYRLGILGFLSTEDSVVPGNNGLKDQTLALKWVQKNIAVFGGNPDSVTLIGFSAGAASVHYHYLSPLSRGLFHRGISISGSALAPWAYAENMREKAENVGVLLGCEIDTSDHLVNCLRNIHPKEIVNQTKHFKIFGDMPFCPFRPVAERPSNHAFITQHPLHILQNGNVQDSPWITSVTAEEAYLVIHELMSNTAYLQHLDREFSSVAPYFLDYYSSVPPEEDVMSIGEKIRHFYFEDKPIDEENIDLLIKLAGDRLVFYSSELSARLQADRNKSPVYFYYFSYKGSNSYLHDNHGPSHGEDAAYIFGSPDNNTAAPESDYKMTEFDHKMTELLLHLFKSFIHTGVPETPSHIDTDWPPINIDSGNLTYLHIVSPEELRVEYTEDLGNRKFWESLPIREPHDKPLKISDEL